MMHYSAWAPFFDWLKFPPPATDEAPNGRLDADFYARLHKSLTEDVPGDNDGWSTWGLKDGAPESAKKAYAEFIEMEKKNREQGIV